MEEGFVIDRAHLNLLSQQEWAEGEPRSSFWTGLNIAGKRHYKVETFRCERCGRLESYAREGAG